MNNDKIYVYNVINQKADNGYSTVLIVEKHSIINYFEA